MKIWTLQPSVVADQLIAGKPFICDPSQSDLYQWSDIKEAYSWITREMHLRIPKPENVILPTWAWFKTYGDNRRPDRRRGLFNGYSDREVILELEVPDEHVLLTDFDNWHYVLNNCSFITEEEYEADPDREYTQEEMETSWLQILNTDESDFVQACIWQIQPEHLVKVYKNRNREK